MSSAIIIISALFFSTVSAANVSTSDSTLLNGFSLTDYIKQCGYPVEVHKNIQTEDNYLLTAHRIFHNNSQNRPPVLLMHGLGGSAPNWILMGPNKSLAFLLADQGYDVWLGNARGTTYSKKHATLNSQKDGKYWDFSWHEIGFYDLPAIIQYMLKTTGQDKVAYVGHSQGTTTFFVMLSTRPAMNKVVKLMVALAPGVFYLPVKLPFGAIANAGPYTFLEEARRALQIHEIPTVFTELTCAKPVIPLFGLFCKELVDILSRSNLSASVNKRVRQTVPDSAAVRQFLHYVQLYVSGTFAQYDYGKELNKKKYGASTAPKYDLSRVEAPVAFFMGQFDLYGLPINSRRLQKHIKNVVLFHVMEDKAFNHFNFIIDNDIKEMVNEKVIKLLDDAV